MCIFLKVKFSNADNVCTNVSHLLNSREMIEHEREMRFEFVQNYHKDV